MAEFSFTEDMIGIRGERKPARYVNGAPCSHLDRTVPTKLFLTKQHYVFLPVRQAGITAEARAALLALIAPEPVAAPEPAAVLEVPEKPKGNK